MLDPFAGTGKIGKLKQYGYQGKIYANELEKEWLEINEFNCDILTFQDAEFLDYSNEFFDAVCTSPTYGNRMADYFNAKDGSKRLTYTHCLGHQLTDGNTGKMQWGEEYRVKHEKIYSHLAELLKHNGIFILNIKNHIRNGKEINVKEFHKQCLLSQGLTLKEEKFIETPSLKYGENCNARTKGEYILVFLKS